MTGNPPADGDRFEDPPAVPRYPIPLGPNTSVGSIELWGRLAPFDMGTGDHLDPKTHELDPESYQERARWAVLVELDPERVCGDDEPPPDPKRDDPPPFPPPDPPPEEKDPEEDPHAGDPTDPEDEGPNPRNPQERNVAAPAIALPEGFTGIALPETSSPLAIGTQAFTTETGAAKSPHPTTISIAEEDEEDAANGGSPSSVPLTATCPLEDLPFFPLPDVGIGVLFL
jgi:hypothetical protein